jgi:hypothetical protein
MPVETREQRQQRKYREDIEGAPRALDSSCEFQREYKDATGYGALPPRHIFTRHAAETIQECLWIAKQKFDNQGIFCTGTVPLDSDLASWLVMCHSGYIFARIKQWIRREFAGDYTAVLTWENTKRGRPHCHMALLSNDHEALLRWMASWHDVWFGILRDLTCQTGVNLFARYTTSQQCKSLMSWLPVGEATQSDVQLITQDVSRYLSKYISKGERREQTNSVYHPSRWWSVDNKTRQEARAERCRLSVGGVPLDTLKVVFKQIRDYACGYAEKFYDFVNPVFLGYHGFVTFCQPGDDLTPLAMVARWLAGEGLEYSLVSGS